MVMLWVGLFRRKELEMISYQRWPVDSTLLLQRSVPVCTIHVYTLYTHYNDQTKVD